MLISAPFRRGRACDNGIVYGEYKTPEGKLVAVELTVAEGLLAGLGARGTG